jgi:HSP20 family protein
MSILARWQRPDVANWAPVGRLLGLQEELNRMFAGPLSELAARGSELLNVWSPALDVYEDTNNVYVKAELPGLKKEDIEVSLEDGVLNLSGERKNETRTDKAAQHRSERFVGKFNRSLTLPAEVKFDQVDANYKDGVLTVTLPKAEQAKRKNIEVKVN